MSLVQPRATNARSELCLIAATASLGLASLRAAFFLRTDKAQTTTMLADNARTLNAFCEPAEKLFEAFRLAEFNTHALTTTYLYHSSRHPLQHGGDDKSHTPKSAITPLLGAVYDTRVTGV